MVTLRMLIGLALGISLAAFARQVRAQENGAEVVAEIGGHMRPSAKPSISSSKSNYSKPKLVASISVWTSCSSVR